MERVNFSYSLKNIPIPSKNEYLKNMIFKLESFIKALRWKVIFFKKSEIPSEAIVNNFGFKSVRTPPKNEHLNAFETDLYDMVVTSNLRELIQNSKVTCQKTSNALLKTGYYLNIPADKTNNL